MKKEKEILEEIESLRNSRDSFVIYTPEWHMFDYAIKELEWVIEAWSIIKC